MPLPAKTERRLAQNASIAAREEELQRKQAAIDAAQAYIQSQVAKKIRLERGAIAAAEGRKATLLLPSAR
ncbi:hypothetical protein [Mesorhizobium sp. M0208]|uniref:hypothetical protein n=1 Tax=Mesorhizobium sp. M0208 TaxID=2956916 RepID=UPI00333DDDFB